jgi:uncharacterized protein YceH (UPF0502 family)
MIFMSSPLVQAFFLGKAVAETLREQLDHSLTDFLSEVGKFDAEQRDRLRQFTSQVYERARQAEAAAKQDRVPTNTPVTSAAAPSGDLQALLDDLRAEVARLRAELKQFRDRP